MESELGFCLPLGKFTELSCALYSVWNVEFPCELAFFVSEACLGACRMYVDSDAYRS